ncbi:MAG TPA: hypothetical protein VF789_25655 [Thermoanaerobaculia bacterium]
MRVRGLRLWRWFFPERVELPEEVKRVIRAVLPTLDLDRVIFHHGVPHLIRLVGSQAITIPDLWLPRRTRVYIDPRHWDTETVEGIGTLVHEAYHALQIQESGWGFGPFRPFLALYFACGASNRFQYKGHPMEEDAYEVAGRRRSRFESTFAAALPAPEALERECECLAAPSSGVRFWRKLAASTPLVRRFATPEARVWAVALLGSPPIALWLLVWMGAASLVWVARVLVETGGALVAGPLRALESLLRSLGVADSASRS